MNDFFEGIAMGAADGFAVVAIGFLCLVLLGALVSLLMKPAVLVGAAGIVAVGVAFHRFKTWR